MLRPLRLCQTGCPGIVRFCGLPHEVGVHGREKTSVCFRQKPCMFWRKALHVLEKSPACFHKKPCMFLSFGFDRVMYHSAPVASTAMGENGAHSHKMPVKRGIFCRFLREDKVKILNYSLYISLFRHFFRIFATIFKERQS